MPSTTTSATGGPVSAPGTGVRGFTLFEVAISLVILAFGVVSIMTLFPAGLKAQQLARFQLYAAAKEHRAPFELVRWVAENGKLPVVTFTAGGIATPADAALCMQLGADGVFVGSGIFKSGDPDRRAKAIVEATTHFEDPKILADVSAGLGEPMVGISASTLPEAERLEVRGW